MQSCYVDPERNDHCWMYEVYQVKDCINCAVYCDIQNLENAWSLFWDLCEKEWAERQKKDLYYPDGPCDWCSEDSCSNCEHSDQEDPCEFGFSEECVEPSLRDSNCCFECWLYSEVDSEDQKNAKSLEKEAECS